MSVSVIITTYHQGRQSALDDIATAWLQQPVEQVWILDALGSYRPRPFFEATGADDRFQVFNLPTDLGNGADYAFALLTSGDHIILADDDMLPEPGFVARCYEKAWAADILGVIGRRFKGPQYRGDTVFVGGVNIEEPVPVDFVGVCTFCHRSCFGFDVRGLWPELRNCDDLWWQMRERPELSKAVIPVGGLYSNLPTCNGETAMFHGEAELKQSRQDFYEDHYRAGRYYHALKAKQ